MLLIVELNLSLSPLGWFLLVLRVGRVLVFGGMLVDVPLESFLIFGKFMGMARKIGSPFCIVRVAAVIKLGQGLFGDNSEGQKCDVVKHLISF